MVQVIRNEKESTGSLLRRFSKRVQLSGFLTRARGNRFYEKKKSDYTKKKEALRRVAWQKDMEHKRKLGKTEQ